MDYPSVAVAVYKPFTFYKVRENLEIVDPFGVQKTLPGGTIVQLIDYRDHKDGANCLIQCGNIDCFVYPSSLDLVGNQEIGCFLHDLIGVNITAKSALRKLLAD